MKYVKEAGSGEYEEKKSRFIGELYPVKSEEEAQEILQQVRKKYYDARHHCFAYVLGEKGEIKSSPMTVNRPGRQGCRSSMC